MATRTSQTANRAVPPFVRVAAALALAVVFLVGLWFLAGRVADDMTQSMALTAGWFALVGAVTLYVAVRSRALRLPMIGTYVALVAVVGGYLGYSSINENTVVEQVAVAGSGTGNTELRRGEFVTDAHPTSGRASVIRTSRGRRVLTLTDLETDPGPDLRVYLATGDGADVDDNVDLGGLKGNKGTQQYDIPAGTDLEKYTAVVIWCRAFSVSFGRAVLANAA